MRAPNSSNRQPAPSGDAAKPTFDGSSTGSLNRTSMVTAGGRRPSNAARHLALVYMPCAIALG